MVIKNSPIFQQKKAFYTFMGLSAFFWFKSSHRRPTTGFVAATVFPGFLAFDKAIVCCTRSLKVFRGH